MRTIIDILNKGNLELFHSAMVAWLLDPYGEHGLNDTVLKNFLSVVAAKSGNPAAIKGILGRLDAWVQDKAVYTGTEVPDAIGRYDIAVRFGKQDQEQFLLLIENKTRTVGGESQLVKYRGRNPDNTVLVALGFCETSFDDPPRGVVVLEYRDVLRCIPASTGSSSPFSTLVRQYSQYLEREFRVIATIRHLADASTQEAGEFLREHRESLQLKISNVRFYNLFFLELFRRHLLQRPLWRGVKWSANNGMVSGSWLACPGLNNKSRFRLQPRFQSLCEKYAGGAYFHLELPAFGLFSKGDAVGFLQLRGGAQKNTQEFAAAFAKEIDTGEKHQRQVKANAKTFVLTKEPVLRSKLAFADLEQFLNDFAARFGTLSNGVTDSAATTQRQRLPTGTPAHG